MDVKERLEQSLKEMQEMRADTDDGVYVDGEKVGGVKTQPTINPQPENMFDTGVNRGIYENQEEIIDTIIVKLNNQPKPRLANYLYRENGETKTGTMTVYK